jgi:hypothetical protein
LTLAVGPPSIDSHEPNTGEPLGLNRRMVVAENTIWHDREHASYVVLPIVPPSLGTVEE